MVRPEHGTVKIISARLRTSQAPLGTFQHTILELTAPLRLPLYAKKIVTSNEDCPAGKYTHKLMTIAMETLRLEDPSTLFETHALGMFRQEELRVPNRPHIVLAKGGAIDQISAISMYCALTNDRVNPTGRHHRRINEISYHDT